ncbi:MAG: cell division ATP-binding protein FtsE [Bacillota bacterium]|nr:cell division ATP-binding protein FtsE [Bacillota bacterium]
MIKFNNVTKYYSGGIVALDNINIHIEKGEFVFIVGQSGAGKSTFVKMLLKEEPPTKGEIIIDDMKINDLHRRRVPYLRRKMGVVFQDFRLLSKKTAYENIAYSMEIIGAKPKEVRKRVPLILSMVGLSSRANVYPDQLSGGEQQRVSMARAMINNPSLLIADEPTGNLDPETSWEIMRLLKQFNRNGTTVVMATHDQNIVDAMKMRVIQLKNGKIIRDQAKGGY